MSKGFKISAVVVSILGSVVLATENIYNHQFSGVSLLDLSFFIIPLIILIFLIIYLKTKKELFLWVSMIPVFLLCIWFIFALYGISQIRG